MKLVNLNIGIKIDNAQEVGQFLQGQNPDFVALQEVVRHLDSTVFPMYQSQSVIKSLLRPTFPFSFFGPLWVANGFTENGRVYRDFGGYIEQGNEILSKFPITEATNEFYYKNYSLEIDWTHFKEVDHPRAVQIVEFVVEGKRLQILNFHGSWNQTKKGNERTMKQCEYIIKAALRKDIATIITGDFNLLPDSESIHLFDTQFRNLTKEYKIMTTRPDFKDTLESGSNVVDYIFVNDKIEVTGFEVIDSRLSDHFPLILDFEVLK